MTQRSVLRTALDRGPISRVELARLTGLSKQTMSDVVRELEEAGWLEEAGQMRSSVGRAATTYGVPARRMLVAAVDLGGTRTRAALADLHGTFIAEADEATAPEGGEAVRAQIVRLVGGLLDEAGAARKTLLACTLGVPGAYDRATGRLAMVPNIAGIEGLGLSDDLATRLGCAVSIDNDVNIAAMGEQWRGEGSGIDNFAFIALGTGIGMGIISGGSVLRGSRGAAGELATLPVGADPFDGRTFRSGALETSISSMAIAARYAGRSGRERVSVREIVDLAAAGDTDAGDTLDELARLLAQAVLAVCAVVDPARVIFGGSIGAREEIVERVRRALPLCMLHPPECTASRLGGRAGLVGGIAASLETMRDMLFSLDKAIPGLPSQLEAI